MPNAVIKQSIYNPPHTAAGLADAIATAFIDNNLGTLFDSFTEGGGNIHRVFKIKCSDTPDVKNDAYLDIYSVYLVSYPNQRPLLSFLYDGFSVASHSGTNASGQVSVPGQPSNWFSFSTNSSPFVINTVNHPEVKLIYIAQSSLVYGFNVFRPANIPENWNEKSYLYAFMGYAGLLSFYPVGLNPFGVSTPAPILNHPALANPNQITGARDICNGLVLIHPGSRGIVAKTSDDLALVAGSGMNFGDIVVIKPDEEEYALITSGNSPGVGIRVK